jgi:hypothetical protein
MKPSARVVPRHDFVDCQVVNIDLPGAPAEQVQLQARSRTDDRRPTQGEFQFVEGLEDLEPVAAHQDREQKRRIVGHPVGCRGRRAVMFERVAPGFLEPLHIVGVPGNKPVVLPQKRLLREPAQAAKDVDVSIDALR